MLDYVRVCMVIFVVLFFFFFQAEDGIRDYKVTGVQTCALPISSVVEVVLVNERVPEPQPVVVLTRWLLTWPLHWPDRKSVV